MVFVELVNRLFIRFSRNYTALLHVFKCVRNPKPHVIVQRACASLAAEVADRPGKKSSWGVLF